MHLIKTLGLAAGCALLAACGGAEEEAAENLDANLMATDNVTIATDNLMVNDMNMANDVDLNMTNDMNAANTMDATNTATNAY